MLTEEAIDWFAELIDESAGPDWHPRDAARHIVSFLKSESAQANDFRNVLRQILGVSA